MLGCREQRHFTLT